MKTYKSSEIASMGEEALYALAKELRVPGAATMDTRDMRRAVGAHLSSAARLTDDGPVVVAGAAPGKAAPAVARAVMVSYGSQRGEFPQLEGKTVAQAMQSLSTAWSIDPKALIRLNGSPVSDPATVKVGAGDELEFIRAAGEKG